MLSTDFSEGVIGDRFTVSKIGVVWIGVTGSGSGEKVWSINWIGSGVGDSVRSINCAGFWIESEQVIKLAFYQGLELSLYIVPSLAAVLFQAF